MISGGDELGRTQLGNNNAYCQDNEISWTSWELDAAAEELLEFTRRLARLRHDHPVFHRRHFFQGQRVRGSEQEDLAWFAPDGGVMSEADWHDPETRSFGMRLAGDAMPEWDEHGERVMDDTLLVLFNAGDAVVDFSLPRSSPEVEWSLVLTTSDPAVCAGDRVVRGGEAVTLAARSLAVLRRRDET
jgi:glycogen operon protein